MAILTIMRGIPGSGKSTYVAKHFPDAIVLSTDEIRKELSGSYQNFDYEKEMWARIHWELDHPQAGRDYVVDATSISNKKCISYLRFAKNFDEVNLVWLDIPLKVALERNAQRRREKVVPNSAILRMHQNLNRNIEPLYEAGFNHITIVNRKDE